MNGGPTDEEVGFIRDIVGAPVRRIEPLQGLTNRNYRVTTDDEVVAVRLPGRGTDAYIDRAAERHNAQRAAALGVGCEIRALEDDGTMLAAFVEGEVLTPERLREDRATLARAAVLLRRVHDEAEDFQGRFDPLAEIHRHRAALVTVPEGVDDLIEAVGKVDPSGLLAPCHNDPWPQNFIDAGEHLYLLDWEYSGMNDPAWDLADLSVEAGLDDRAESAMLDAYGGDAELRERVGVWKPVSDVVWGLWALVQHADGNPAEDFETYGRTRLARAREW